MKGAALAAGEPGTVEEDAGSIHDAGVDSSLVAEDPFGGGSSMLEPRRVEHGGEGTDEPGLVLIAELGAHRAASLAERLGGLIEDAEAAPTPDAGPVRSQELLIEPPDGVVILDDDRCGFGVVRRKV